MLTSELNPNSPLQRLTKCYPSAVLAMLKSKLRSDIVKAPLSFFPLFTVKSTSHCFTFFTSQHFFLSPTNLYQKDKRTQSGSLQSRKSFCPPLPKYSVSLLPIHFLILSFSLHTVPSTEVYVVSKRNTEHMNPWRWRQKQSPKRNTPAAHWHRWLLGKTSMYNVALKASYHTQSTLLFEANFWEYLKLKQMEWG
jgi:hypothetical protein